jgi:nucleotide-binding universal stress UspA family protein
MDDSDAGARARMPSAVHDFHEARQRAALGELLARLRGRSQALLSYDEVVRHLKPTGSAERGLRDIPLDAITGSVGRTQDFTREFLPRRDEDQERWARVRVAVTDPNRAGLPPIKVYQIGEAYFVIDGHHRISVARRLGATHIQAYVTEVRTKVPLSAAVRPDDLILVQEYGDFLEHTRLDQTRPGADLRVSEPGATALLEGQIRHHQAELERQREPKRQVTLPAAAAEWYDQAFLPVVGAMRELGLPREFPGYTEADLYLLVSQHRAALEEALGWSITPEVGASDLAAKQAGRRRAPVVRAGRRLLSAVVPDPLKAGPATGEWRASKLAARYGDRLFADLLVPVSGEAGGWTALDYALEVAQRERAQLQGLHVVGSEAQRHGEAAQRVRQQFNERCAAARVAGSLAVEAGEVAATICKRAALSDLVVLNLAHPPAPQGLARLSSGFHTIIQRCPRPVLAVPQPWPAPQRVLLAYDDGPKAREALFVAAYLGEAWHTALTVVTIREAGTTGDPLNHAREYLEMHELQANFIARGAEPVATTILLAAEDDRSDLIVIGGYGGHPVVQAVLGSTVDQVLRAARRPTLICR